LEKKDKVDEDELHRHEYPLDGKWKLIWLNASGSQQTGNITVRNNEFQQGPYLFNLDYTEPEKIRFRWPLDPVYAAAKSGVNLKKKPTGPPVGERIVWDTTHPAFREITWQRESLGEPPIQRTVHFGFGNNEYAIDSAGDKAGDAAGDDKSDKSSDDDGWEDKDDDSKSSSSGGDSDGDSDGESDGDSEGDSKGDSKGDAKGDTKGDTEGDTEGDAKGDTKGDTKGVSKDSGDSSSDSDSSGSSDSDSDDSSSS
jgi:hypothetical protein